MESFTWGKNFVTGIAEVDDQHRQLVDMLNGFGEVIAGNVFDKDYLLATFENLADYAQYHFAAEEKLMSRMQVDRRHVRRHIRQHTDFVADISSMAEAMDVNSVDESRALLEYLIHWLAYHILGTDKNMGRQIDEIRAGSTPKEAYFAWEVESSSSTQPLVVALSGLFALVSKSNKALRDLNRTLEQRVAERTKELTRANEALKKISVTDHLTELPNRRFAMAQLDMLLEEAATTGRSFSCLMIDADNFKDINDTFGHDAGDEVLRRLARELKESVRSDDIVCRLGGDEFIIICPDTDLQGAMLLGEQTRKRIAALKVPAGRGWWHGSLSMGAACAAPADKDVKVLLKNADKAVYEAKRCGKNCIKSL